jgi:hypothetical protein
VLGVPLDGRRALGGVGDAVRASARHDASQFGNTDTPPASRKTVSMAIERDDYCT